MGYVKLSTKDIRSFDERINDVEVATENTLNEYIDDIEQAKLDIGTMGSVKADIQGVISTGQTLKQDLDNNISSGNSVKESLDSAISNANTTKQGLESAIANGDINSIHSQLADIAKRPTSNAKINIQASNSKMDYNVYQAVVENPLNAPYTNAPIRICATFEKGEVLSEKNIEIVCGSTKYNFQIEGEVHQKTGVDVSKYNDGSLKNVYLWINDSLLANEVKIYNINVYDYELTRTFVESVTYTITGEGQAGETRKLSANGVELEFLKSNIYILQTVYADTIKINSAGYFFRTDIKNNTYTDQVQYSATTNLSLQCIGSGVVFKDFIVTSKSNFSDNVIIVTKHRLYANGDFEVESTVKTLADVVANTINGVAFKHECAKDSAEVITQGNRWNCFNYSGAKALMCLVHDLQVAPEGVDWGAITPQIVYNSSSTLEKIQSYWQFTSPATMAFSKGASWSTRYLFSVKGFTKADASSKATQMYNKINSRMTNKNIDTLKRKIIEQASYILSNNDAIDNNETIVYHFRGCRTIANLMRGIIRNDVDISDIMSQFNTFITERYNGGSSDAIYSKWFNDDMGIEFIGRDMGVIHILYEYLVKIGDNSNANIVKAVILNAADFFYRVEQYSGSNGSIKLHKTTPGYVINAQTAAMKALRVANEITFNQIYEDCLNRIHTKFAENIKFNVLLKQTDTQDEITYQASHYQAFSLFEYVRAWNNKVLNCTQYVNELINPSGSIKEFGYQSDPKKRGIVTNLLYVAGILVKYNNVSFLENVLKILEHVSSKCYATGYHEYPIDGWSSTDDKQFNVTIESQILSEIIWELITE